MKKIEVSMNSILLNLQLAQKYMDTNDFNLAIHRIQDARRSMENLKVNIKKPTDADINRQNK